MARFRRWLVRTAVGAIVIALACFAYDWSQSVSPRPGVQALVATVDPQKLRAHVERIAGFGPHPEVDRKATAAVLAWLEGELRGLGLEPRRESFDAVASEYELRNGVPVLVETITGLPHCNLIVEKRGSDADSPALEVGAHYDSVPWGPGADDNGSGVAALLEVARLLAAAKTTRTVRLCFFAMEEEGLVGSAAHVHALQARGERVAGAIVLDMVGFSTSKTGSQGTPLRVPLLFDPPTQGDFLVDCGNFASGWLGNLYEACATAYVPAARFYSINRLAAWFEDAVRSDHASYWRAGIPAILLSDTAEMRNPNYHKPTDTPATVDFAFLHANAQALAATVLHWAGDG
jgi:aminopeptidase YwaD